MQCTRFNFGMCTRGVIGQCAMSVPVMQDGPCRTGEQAVMPDAVEAARQDVEQEAADELVGRQRHDLLPFGTARR
jgi:hypothetical protein